MEITKFQPIENDNMVSKSKGIVHGFTRSPSATGFSHLDGVVAKD